MNNALFLTHLKKNTVQWTLRQHKNGFQNNVKHHIGIVCTTLRAQYWYRVI